jgi:exopolyphosphatase/guanosine-5'-triphosphate,3'-diphosphate pyrophosphatase
VARLALSIFHQTRELHGLTNSDSLLLEYATILHDIGFHISGNRHHRHAQYLIMTHDMRGFSQEEIEIIALIARYHRKTAPKKSHPEFSKASKEVQKKVSKLTAILRVADSLDRTHATLVPRPSAARSSEDDRTSSPGPTDDPELEHWTARRKGHVRRLFDAPNACRRPACRQR